MPIYEYECDGCGEVFAVRQKLTDPPPASHEPCGSTQLHRVLSATTFVLKGSGWYKTDYADKPRPKEHASRDAQRQDGGDAAGSKDGKSGKDGPSTSDGGHSSSTANGASEAGSKSHSSDSKTPPDKGGSASGRGKQPAA